MQWFQFLAGMLGLIGGILIIRNRVRVARWQARMFRITGGRGAEESAQGITPGTMFIVGSVWIIVGVCLTVRSIVAAVGGS